MRKVLIAISILISLLIVQCQLWANPNTYERIVSLAPSNTEILYALDVGHKVVGVTNYCEYPPEAKLKEKVGGFLDTSYESIYSLSPDLVIVQDEVMGQEKNLEKMGLKVFVAQTKSVDGILSSIRLLGEELGQTEQAKVITDQIEQKISEIKVKTKDFKKPRVLVTFSRSIGEGKISEIYVAGHDTYLEDLIEIAGGVNAYQGTDFITSPLVSSEGILQINPDVIIEIIPNLSETRFSVDQVKADWNMYSEINAFKNNQIFIIDDPVVSIPGPRLTQALDIIARCVHPQID